MSLDYKKNHLPHVVSSGGGPAAHGLAGTSDYVHWTARDARRSDLTRPQTRGLANYWQYISTYIQLCLEYPELIYPRWSRVEVVLRPTGSQAPPITSIGRLETQAEVIYHARRPKAWRTVVNIYLYIYIYKYTYIYIYIYIYVYICICICVLSIIKCFIPSGL